MGLQNAEDGNKVEAGKFVAVLWTIWRQRNNKLWNDTIEDSNKAVLNAQENLYDWLAMKKKVIGIHEESENRGPTTVWRKPHAEFLKCNVDASFFSEIRCMGFGMVIRDHTGTFMGFRTMIMEGLYDVKEGESMGLCETLLWIRGMNLKSVINEMDAQIVVRAINSSKNDKSEFGFIIEDCQRILQQEPSFFVVYINRLANGVAHFLAKESRFFANPSTWSSPPSHIGDIVARDALFAR